tara:strand:+ start:541 stop:4665 length:4125 start_codon:yes stop_codon:yes gene_type:complete
MKIIFKKKKSEISVIKNLESEFKQVIHLADIHIRNKSDRDDEYRSVIEHLNLNIKNDKQLKKNETLIIICGDIFHDARKDGKLSPNAIQMFKNLISKLKKLGTLIIIPGNHDNNITYQSDDDNTIIDALKSQINDYEEYKSDVFYLAKTGIFQFGNILLSTVSVFDIDKINLPEFYKERLNLLDNVSINQDNKYKDLKKVFAGHFGIDGAKIENKYVLKDCCYKVTDLEKYDMVFLGDTHKHQFLGDRKQIGYPNSLIQQDYSESIREHGYIKWNIEKNKGEFIEIENEYAHIEIDSNDNIENIDFPKNSYIKYYTKHDDLSNTENIKEQIQKKTNIKCFKIKKKFIDESHDTINIHNELNDDQKKLDYLKNLFPEKSTEEHKILIDKLNKDENKYKTETGRSTLNFKKLSITDFQIYNGVQTIDFDKYHKNTTISINGNNTTGKSTIVRSIEFVLFGPEKGKHESYINNNKSSCKCTIEYEHDNISYRITRIINKKGINKHDLKLEKKNNDKWENLSDKHTKTTQEKIYEFFGTKENAEITWLKQQDSNDTFRHNKDNFSTFQRFISADMYHKITEDNKKKCKNVKEQLKMLNTQKEAINIVKPEYNLDELNNKKKNIELKLIDYEKEIKNEVNKKQYGTNEEKTKWENEILNNYEDIKKNKINLIDIDINEYEYENKILLFNSNIDKLSLKKDDLLSNLPPKPESFYSDKTLEDIDIKINEINENLFSNSCKKSLPEINTKIGGLEADLKREEETKKKYKHLIDTLEKQKEKLKEISVDSENLDKEQKSLDEINETITKNNSKIDNNIIYKPNHKLEKEKEKVNLETEFGIKKTNIKESKEKIIDLSDYDNIEKEYKNLLKTETDLKNEESNRKIIENNLSNTNENLDKYKALKFNSNCECCNNNKSHYEIDVYEQNIKNLNNILKKSNEDINEYNKILDNLKPYKKLYETYNENIKYEKNINDTNKELECIKLKLVNIDRDLEDIDKIKKINDKNYEILNENKELEKTKSNKTNIIDKIKKDIEKKNKLESEINDLTIQLNSINYSEKNYKTLTEELDEYINIKNLHESKISFEEQKDNIITNENYNKIQKDINQINNNISEDKKELEKLQNNYDKSCKYRNNILNKEANICNLKQKINDYNEKGGYNQYNIDKLENDLWILKRNKEDIIEKIGEIKCIQKEYDDSIKKQEDLNAKIIKKNNELNNIEEYLKIVDPRKGYPNEIIKYKLQYFNNIINEFIKNAKFKFEIKIDPPELVEDSKKQNQKLTFNFIKDNKTFSNLSGAENFIADLAITSSLSKILDTISPPLLAIDEGFSCLDQNHIDEIPSLLDRIKTEFNYILYISHNKSIKGKADNNIYIEKCNNESCLLFS